MGLLFIISLKTMSDAVRVPTYIPEKADASQRSAFCQCREDKYGLFICTIREGTPATK
jgi:hypothetical protein